MQDVSIRIGVGDISELRDAFRLVRSIWAMAVPATQQLQNLVATGASLEGKKLNAQQRKSLSEMVKSYENFFKEMAHVWGQFDAGETEKLSSMTSIVNAMVEKIKAGVEMLENAVTNIQDEIGIKYLRKTLKSVQELKTSLIGDEDTEERRGPGRPMPLIKRWLQEYYKMAINSMKKEGINIEKAEITGVRGTTLFKNIERRVNEAFDTYIKEEMSKMEKSIVTLLATLKKETINIKNKEIKVILKIIEQIKDAISSIIKEPEKIIESIESIKKAAESIDLKKLTARLKQIETGGIESSIVAKIKEVLENVLSEEKMESYFKANVSIKKMRSLINETVKSTQKLIAGAMKDAISSMDIPTAGKESIENAVTKKQSPSNDMRMLAAAFKKIREYMEERIEISDSIEGRIISLMECCEDVKGFVQNDILDVLVEIQNAQQNMPEVQAKLPSMDKIIEAIPKMEEMGMIVPDELKNILNNIQQGVETLPDKLSDILDRKLDDLKIPSIPKEGTIPGNIKKLLDKIEKMPREVKTQKVTKAMIEKEIKALPVSEITKVRKDVFSVETTSRKQFTREMLKLVEAVDKMKETIKEEVMDVKNGVSEVSEKLDEEKRTADTEPTSTTKIRRTRSKRRGR